MTSTHVSRGQLDRLRRGTLPPAEAEALGHHAAACESCRAAIAAASSADRKLHALRASLYDVEHLPPEVLMSIADGARDDTGHLAECEDCRAEVAELQRLKPRPRFRPRFAYVAAAAAIVVVVLLFRTPPPPTLHPPAAPPITHPPPPEYARPEWAREVAAVRAQRALPIPAVIDELRPQSSSLRGGEEHDDVRLHPNGIVVAATRPRLQWTPRDGARYRVILQHRGRITESSVLTASDWTPAFDLERGGEYAWQVEVTVGDTRSIHPHQPQPPARFRVVDGAALDEIAEARRRHPGDALLHAVILARYGLWDEALEAIGRLEKTDPALAGALRRSLAGASGR